MLSDPIHVTVDDIHFIFGPKPPPPFNSSEFKSANAPYDQRDQIYNLEAMHRQCDEEDRAEVQAEREREEADR